MIRIELRYCKLIVEDFNSNMKLDRILGSCGETIVEENLLYI